MGFEAVGEVRLTGFVEFENQNKQSFQREDIGDKFFHTNGLGIYIVLCMCVSVYLSCVKQNTALRSAFCYLLQNKLKLKNEVKMLLFLVKGIQCLSCCSVAVMLRTRG